jgi:hypothetical protein
MAVNYHGKKLITLDNGGKLKNRSNLLWYFNHGKSKVYITAVNYQSIFITLALGPHSG